MFKLARFAVVLTLSASAIGCANAPQYYSTSPALSYSGGYYTPPTRTYSGGYPSNPSSNQYQYGNSQSGYSYGGHNNYPQTSGGGAMYPSMPTQNNRVEDVYQSEVDRDVYRNQSAVGMRYNSWYRDGVATDDYAYRSQINRERMTSRNQALRYRDLMSIPRTITRGTYESARDIERTMDLFKHR